MVHFTGVNISPIQMMSVMYVTSHKSYSSPIHREILDMSYTIGNIDFYVARARARGNVACMYFAYTDADQVSF